MAPEAAELAGPGLKAVCQTLGIPPVLHMGSCVDNTRIINGDTFMSHLEEKTTPNQTIILTILRHNQIQDIPVVLKQRPTMD